MFACMYVCVYTYIHIVFIYMYVHVQYIPSPPTAPQYPWRQTSSRDHTRLAHDLARATVAE